MFSCVHLFSLGRVCLYNFLIRLTTRGQVVQMAIAAIDSRSLEWKPGAYTTRVTPVTAMLKAHVQTTELHFF